MIALKKNRITQALLSTGMFALASVGASSALAADGESIIRDRCLGCHVETGESATPFSRISEQRKTPEGWLMAISRMQQQRGLVITPEEKRTLVKYLADTQGLAPAETRELRYVLEKQPNVTESFEPWLQDTCVRCHSGARIGLQRRTEEDWKWLVHFHMGQQPTAELHAGARDRAWFDIALNQVAPKLGQVYGLNTQEWSDWQAADKQSLSGRWVMSGYLPEKGQFDATVHISELGNDKYSVTMDGQYADGTPLTGKGSGIVYTSYDWRGAVTINGVKMRQVLAASEDGQSLNGRMFKRDDDVLGGQVTAIKGAGITAVSPSYIRQGERKLLTISGNKLNGSVHLGAGVKVVSVVSRDDNRVVVVAEASQRAESGHREVRVGKLSSEMPLAVYDQLARVDITPSDSIARVGGGGGALAKQKSWYRAVGYAAGADGKPGTEDDIRLGYMPASWSLKPFDEIAEHDGDIKYAGTIDDRGIFTPGDAGPNPERKMSTNNVGNLTVTGTVHDGNQVVSGDSHLLVTVQKFVRALID
ncbi:quinohemoprotein amine dehydrogenase subunit alpha [Oceanospirillum sediminis]